MDRTHRSTSLDQQRRRETDENKSHFPASCGWVYYIWPLFPALRWSCCSITRNILQLKSRQAERKHREPECVCNNGNKHYSSLPNVNDSQRICRAWHIILRNAIAARLEGSDSTWKTSSGVEKNRLTPKLLMMLTFNSSVTETQTLHTLQKTMTKLRIQ